MSTEGLVLVGVRPDERVNQLVGDIASAAARSHKADPGDRTDIVRYELLSVELEAAAIAALMTGAPHMTVDRLEDEGNGLAFSAPRLKDPIGPRLNDRLPHPAREVSQEWLDAGAVVILLHLPFQPGQRDQQFESVAAPDPEEVWEASKGVVGRAAVVERFRAQLLGVCEGAASGTRLSVNPSGVHNRVLTEVFREFVEGAPASRLDAPIVYRDGSQASHAFPLRCLTFRDPPEVADRMLHLALLSIRHTEMDPVVDGAWLRNAEVSRPRPAALTDDFVYETSRKQLTQLTESGQRTALLHIYQTGLDTAVVGFYRAVVMHLFQYPYSLSVVPMFYTSAPRDDSLLTEKVLFEPGVTWSMGQRT